MFGLGKICSNRCVFLITGLDQWFFWPGVVDNAIGTYAADFVVRNRVVSMAFKVVEPGGGLWDVGSSFIV